jgi:hypothetical protein
MTIQANIVDGRVVFSGGPYGAHSISADSSAERVEAHWSGYCEVAGVTKPERVVLVKLTRNQAQWISHWSDPLCGDLPRLDRAIQGRTLHYDLNDEQLATELATAIELQEDDLEGWFSWESATDSQHDFGLKAKQESIANLEYKLGRAAKAEVL